MKNGNTNNSNKKRRIVRRGKSIITESSGVGESVRKDGENGSGTRNDETGSKRSKIDKSDTSGKNEPDSRSSGSNEPKIVRVGSYRRRTDSNGRSGSGSDSTTTTTTGTSDSRREENGRTESQRTEVLEVPIRKRRRRLKNNIVEEAAIAGMLSVACTAIYSTTALFFGEHWNVTDDESLMLANSLDNALKTLPSNTYEELRKHFEQFIPWVALAITAGAITIPRIEYSRELARQRSKTGNITNDTGNNAGQSNDSYGKANPFTDTV